MGFILFYRNSDGNVVYFNKIWSTESEAFEFAKSHTLSDYMIVTEEEFQQYLAGQQVHQGQQSGNQRQAGYQQQVIAYSDERELEPRRDYTQPFKPAFFRPAFVGRKRRG